MSPHSNIVLGLNLLDSYGFERHLNEQLCMSVIVGVNDCVFCHLCCIKTASMAENEGCNKNSLRGYCKDI